VLAEQAVVVLVEKEQQTVVFLELLILVQVEVGQGLQVSVLEGLG
jgi:hypothetical protein